MDRLPTGKRCSARRYTRLSRHRARVRVVSAHRLRRPAVRICVGGSRARPEGPLSAGRAARAPARDDGRQDVVPCWRAGSTSIERIDSLLSMRRCRAASGCRLLPSARRPRRMPRVRAAILANESAEVRTAWMPFASADPPPCSQAGSPRSLKSSRVGMSGAGQLGACSALAGYPLGIRCVFLDRSADAPGAQVAPILIGELTDALSSPRWPLQ